MTLLARCPDCGFKSPEIRCPRCNALKVMGCDGGCLACGRSCKAGVTADSETPLPSEGAVEDAEHPGTPLER